ncbi:MAG: methyltransferase, partial [Actinomycetota bacterium]|nr:methyltransferase [Actinomycetota bacterium]
MSEAEVTTRLRRSGCVAAEREAAVLLRRFSEPVPLEAAVRRREAGEPLEHVLGSAELAGVRVAVAPPVFVPRARTEWLVGHAVELVRQRQPRGRAGPPVLDLGCGSGAIAAVLASRLPEAEVLATDVDPAAV